MSALDFVCEDGNRASRPMKRDARAELASLRGKAAELDEANKYVHTANGLIAELRATVAEQARQLSEARRIMVNSVEIANITDSAIPSGVEKWLASTAPAQPDAPAVTLDLRDSEMP